MGIGPGLTFSRGTPHPIVASGGFHSDSCSPFPVRSPRKLHLERSSGQWLSGREVCFFWIHMHISHHLVQTPLGHRSTSNPLPHPGHDFLGMPWTYWTVIPVNASKKQRIPWFYGRVLPAHFGHPFLILHAACGVSTHSHLLQGTLFFKIRSEIGSSGSPQLHISLGLLATLSFHNWEDAQEGDAGLKDYPVKCVILKLKHDSRTN